MIIYGKPGSGKTQCAEIIAWHFGLTKIVDNSVTPLEDDNEKTLVLTQLKVKGAHPITEILENLKTEGVQIVMAKDFS